MKRLIALALTLSAASCDTSTKTADGTSSETQTSLQALADNVRWVPEPPGGADAGASSAAGRMLAVAYTPECGMVEKWTRGGWLQAEQYDGDTWWEWGIDSSKDWASIRNELATDSSGRLLEESCATGYMQALAEHRWRSLSGVLVEYYGRFWRDSGSTGMTNVVWKGAHHYPSGFVLNGRLSERAEKEVVLDPSHADWEYSFGEGRFVFRFHQSREDMMRNRRGSDGADTNICVPVEDLRLGNQTIGSVCMNYRSGSWTIRDAAGAALLSRGCAGPAVDDSLGVRILSTFWEGESLRIALRVRTAPSNLRQWSYTSLWIGDSVGRDQGLEERHLSKTLLDTLPFADTSFVGPRRVDFALHRSALEGRTSIQIELVRKYTHIFGSFRRLGVWWVRIPNPG